MTFDPSRILQQMLTGMGGRSAITFGFSPVDEDRIKKREANIAALYQALLPVTEDLGLLREKLHRTVEPQERGGFLEVGNFEGYTSLDFFYSVAHHQKTRLVPTLDALLSVQGVVEEGGLLTKATEEDRSTRERRYRYAPDDQEAQFTRINELKGKLEAVSTVESSCMKSLLEGILNFEPNVQIVYRRVMDQYRYLQKRFLNIGGEDGGRTYKAPWEKSDDPSGFDLRKVQYVKITPLEDNPLLTDFLLDVSANLPRQRTRPQKVKGKRKLQDVKFLDAFDVDRFARVLVELSDHTYQGYLREPHSFLTRISEGINTYYDEVSSLEEKMRSVCEEDRESVIAQLRLDPDRYEKRMVNPTALTSRLRSIDFKSVLPRPEEVRPSNDLEARYFSARERLLGFLNQTVKAIVAEPNPAQKYELAKQAIPKAVELREKARLAQETRHSTDLKQDLKGKNEFYVGASTDGTFAFEREPAPKIRMKDVYGKTFDRMKEHIADLADYSRYLALYGATAPRGRIRSNMIAIGPYGCGKTEMARAVGGDPKFIGAEVAITDLVTKWFGEFEANVDRVWDGARQLRRASGDTKLVFLLMDEFDSFFSNSEGHWVDTTYARVQKALQMKLDGVVDYEGIITLGLTNEPGRIPLPIYRRFKYVDIVGELEPIERSDLLKHFLTAGLPLSRGFTADHYQHWGELLDGATGDVIGKVADDIHYEYMRKFLHDNPRLARSLNGRVLRMTAKDGEVDKPELKRTLGQYLTVDPDWVEAKVREKMADPVIGEQVRVAQECYRDARRILEQINGAHRPAKTVGFHLSGNRQEPHLAQVVPTASGSADGPGIDYSTKRRT